MSNTAIDKIKSEIEPFRQQIINHPVFGEIQNLNELKIFMNYHVYAVWDFMSLLKALQNSLTCTSIPWFPVGNANTRYFINEIVVGEETDIDANGARKSHFELYVEAMKQSEADINSIAHFIETLKFSGDFANAYSKAQTPQAVQEFVNFTFDVINSGKVYLQAAIFTFGREDLIPGMFISLVKDLANKFPEQISIFKYYLDRHIEVDGDHHSHLALEMMANLCGENELYWHEVLQVTQQSLEQRIKLWDAVLDAINLLRNAN